MSHPTLVTLGISTQCNQDCIFCSACGIRKTTDLDMFEYVKVLMKPGTTIDLTGQGEILLHPQFADMVTLITKSGANCSFSTSGSPLTRNIVHFLDTMSVKIINVSLNSLNADTHKKLTQRAFLPLILNNVEYLLSRPRIYHVSLSMVVTGYNWTEMPDLVQYAIQHRANSVRLLALAPSIKYSDPALLLPHTDEVKECLLAARTLAKNNRLHIDAFSMNPEKKGYSTKCKAPWHQIRIDMDGSVKTCCWSNRTLGNIKEQPFEEIWNGPLWEDFRNSVETGAMTYCQQCREYG